MRHLSALLLFSVSAFFSGCATNASSVGYCDTTAVCLPVMIYPVSEGRFRAYPDLLDIVHDNQERTVVWAFPPHAKFYFDMNPPPGIPRDGVDVTSLASGDRGDVKSCFATDQIDGTEPILLKGRYFRCKVRGHAFLTAAYNVRFHDDANTQRSLDPTVSNTRTPILVQPLQRPTTRKVTVSGVPVKIRLSAAGRVDPMEAVIPASAASQTRIVWSIEESGSVFDGDPSSGTADKIGIPNLASGSDDGCFPVASEDGGDEQVRGSFYQCVVPTNWSALPTPYEIRFRDAQGRQVSVQGVLKK